MDINDISNVITAFNGTIVKINRIIVKFELLFTSCYTEEAIVTLAAIYFAKKRLKQ